MPQYEHWYKLDNAAIIVPASTQGADTRVYRLSVELTEKVDPGTLQKALDNTIIEFPHFQVVLRKGLFWYYLDETREQPKVQPDVLPALSQLYVPGRRNLLLRVLYWQNHISLEMFHVLADGTGAFVFFKDLLCRYLCMRYKIEYTSESDSSSSYDKRTNAFGQYYTRGVQAPKRHNTLRDTLFRRAFWLHGIADDDLRSHLVEGAVSAAAFIAAAHRYHVTATVLTAGLYIEAVLPTMSLLDRKKDIVLSIPVNLRKYFPSDTTRNFFGVINVRYHAAEYDGTLEGILQTVGSSVHEQLQPENLDYTMNSYSKLEHNLAARMVPLLLKEPALHQAARMAGRSVTCTISNLGVIHMPDPLASRVKEFSAFMAAPNMQITIASYGDRMTFGAASALKTHTVLMNFFRRLQTLGMHVTISSNDYDVHQKKTAERA